MRDSDGVLVNYWALVQILRHVVGGGTDKFDTAFLRLLVRVSADESGQERVVDVDNRDPHLFQEVAGQNLHVAGEHNKVDVALEEAENLRLRCRLVRPRLRGNVEERDGERPDILGGVRVVGDGTQRRVSE